MENIRYLLIALALPLLGLNPLAHAQTAATTQVDATAAELAQARARVHAAERDYRATRDRVLDLREERNRLSRQVGDAERRKIKTTAGRSKHADEYASDDLRDYRAELNHINREEARASSRLEDAQRAVSAAKKALALAEQRDRAARRK